MFSKEDRLLDWRPSFLEHTDYCPEADQWVLAQGDITIEEAFIKYVGDIDTDPEWATFLIVNLRATMDSWMRTKCLEKINQYKELKKNFITSAIPNQDDKIELYSME